MTIIEFGGDERRPSITRLEGPDNFKAWERSLHCAFAFHSSGRLRRIVEGRVTFPFDKSEEEQAKWMGEDRQAWGLIFWSLGETVRSRVPHDLEHRTRRVSEAEETPGEDYIATSCRLFRHLMENESKLSDRRRVQLHRTIFLTRIDEGADPEPALDAMREAYYLVKDSEPTLSDDLFTRALLFALPASFNDITGLIRASPTPMASSDAYHLVISSWALRQRREGERRNAQKVSDGFGLRQAKGAQRKPRKTGQWCDIHRTGTHWTSVCRSRKQA